MQTRIMVELNKIALHALDSRIILQGVDESAPSWNLTAQSRASRYGQLYTGTEKRYRDIVVRFAISIVRDLGERERILQQVIGWAAEGGELRLSYRPGQRLYVVCTAPPAVSSIDQWANSYQITFRAYDIPEWMEVSPKRTTVTDSGGTATLIIEANAGGKLEFSAANSSGSACTTMTVTANGQSFIFSSLGLASGSTLQCKYNTHDIQSLKIGSTSVLEKRTSASADDIWLKKGQNEITFSANVSLEWTFFCYGRWYG